MSLLGDLTLSFLLESIALTALWFAMGIVAASLVLGAAHRRLPTFTQLRVPSIAGLAGAMVAGSLSLRFGAPEPLLLAVGRREVPLVWSIGGAAAGALIAWLVGRRAGYARSGSTSGQSISG